MKKCRPISLGQGDLLQTQLPSRTGRELGSWRRREGSAGKREMKMKIKKGSDTTRFLHLENKKIRQVNLEITEYRNIFCRSAFADLRGEEIEKGTQRMTEALKLPYEKQTGVRRNDP